MRHKRRALLALGSAVMALGVLAGSAHGAETSGGNSSWEQAKRLIQYAPPAKPSLPYGVPPTQVGDCWDTILSHYEIDPRTRAARVTGKYPGRECIAEPLPYYSHVLQYLPPDFQERYNGLIANINARLQHCAATEGTWFPGIIRPDLRTPESGPRWTQIIRATNTHAIGSNWTECLKNRAAGEPEIVFVRDEPGTPQMDYDIAVPVSAHARHTPRNPGPLTRDRWMQDHVSRMMGHPTDDQIQGAYGDPFATDALVSGMGAATNLTDLPSGAETAAVVDNLANAPVPVG